MQFLIDSFDFIVNTIKTVWDFFTSILTNTAKMLDYITVVANLAYSLIASLPLWLKSFATITIFISILYLILNRESGGK